MIMADTSVWIEHFRRGEKRLVQLLLDGHIAIHPYVTGELACGSLKNRLATLDYFDAMPQVPVADTVEVRHFIERHALHGHGLGWVDIHLLAAAKLAKHRLWTLDKRLAQAAEKLQVAIS
jgi:predicted nucleic acid-binding protein